MQKSNVIGIDLAKNVIQVCLISKDGELISNKAMSPQRLKELLAKTKTAIVAMEGCSACHYWGRFAKQFSHDVRIISPRKVKAFLQGQKTDANDALAIAVAATQTGMVFSQLKSEAQQTLQSIESSRRLIDRQRVALENSIRAYVYEYGLTSAKGKKGFRELVLSILDNQIDGLPECLKPTLQLLYQQYCQTLECAASIEKQRNCLVAQSEPCKRLKALEGVGDVCATLLYINLGNGSEFKNGRQASAYVGVTPKQYSSGGKVSIKGIDKAGGNKELRAALYQGALAVVSALPDKPKTTKQLWLFELVQRAGVKRACIALANKTVRTAWALMNTGETYKPKALAC
jgi:transposase